MITITLKTLHSAPLQEIFDQVAKHLLTQNEKCMLTNQHDEESCQYRHGSAKCAVGCLIADDEYTVAIEGLGMRALAKILNPDLFITHPLNTSELFALDAATEHGWAHAGLPEPTFRLLHSLQDAHDNYKKDTMYAPPEYIFESDLQNIAETYNLIYDRSKYV